MIWILLAGALGALIWYKGIKPMSYWKDLGVNQTKPWPFLGDSWRSLFRKLSFAEFIEWAYNLHPNSRYMGFYQSTTPTLLLRDPELIKQIAVKDFDHFTDHRSFVDPEADPLWTGNLFALKATWSNFPQERTGYLFEKIIKETIKTPEEKGIVRPDMINLLLEARKGIKHEEDEAIETGFATVKESTNIGSFKQIRNLTDNDITSQALIFFFAGFDTISTGLCFGSYELAINKDIQDKLRDEIKETQKKINGKVTYDVLLKMKYMDMVVSEILRKWPPTPSVNRVCTKSYFIEPVNSNEKPVPINVGDVLVLPIHGIHRDPANYPNPNKLDPERFSDDNKDNIKPYTYIPFGSGPRNCIGSRFALLEIKALLFNLLLHFELVPTKKTRIPLKLDRKRVQHTAEGGFWFGLKRIKP